MTWRHIVIEGYCFHEDGSCDGLSVECLGDGKLCPHFAYAESSGRDVSQYVPLRLILLDRSRELLDNVVFNAMWYLWDKWHFKRYSA